MIEEDLEVAIKVVVVGNGAVGKSSLIQRYCKGSFTKDYKKTIGVDFLEKQIQVKGKDVRLMVWDTAGQEEFDAITKAYYRGAHVCIIAFSCTDRDSFLAIEKWKRKVEEEVEGVVMCVVQNKIDLIDQANMASEEVDEMIKSLRLKLFRTSVKENFNVDQVFEYLANKYLDRSRREKQARNKAAYDHDRKVEMGPTMSERRPSGNVSGSPEVTEQENSFIIQPTNYREKKKRSLCLIL